MYYFLMHKENNNKFLKQITMNTTNIVNFNGVTINKENILATYMGKIVDIQENRYINKSAYKKQMVKKFMKLSFVQDLM